jgi:hypothetical protein
VREWDLYSFAGDAFYASPFHHLTLPAAPTDACEIAAVRGSEIVVIFQGRTAAEKKREQLCDEQRRNRQRNYQSAIASQRQAAVEKTLQFQSGGPEADVPGRRLDAVKSKPVQGFDVCADFDGRRRNVCAGTTGSDTTTSNKDQNGNGDSAATAENRGPHAGTIL